MGNHMLSGNYSGPCACGWLDRPPFARGRGCGCRTECRSH